MKRKVIALVLTACMALGLCACGGSSSSSTQTDKPAETEAAETAGAEESTEEATGDSAEAAGGVNTDVSGKVVIYTSMYEDIIDDMEKELNPDLHRENLKAFSWLLSQLKTAPDLWAAWGTIIEKRPYLPGCVLDMADTGKKFGARWFTAGPRSQKGHPHHPLYLKKDSPLDPFTDLESYLGGLSNA